MEKNIFKLDNEQLKGIAYAFREKVDEGLSKKKCRDTMYSYLYSAQGGRCQREGLSPRSGRYQLPGGDCRFHARKAGHLPE